MFVDRNKILVVLHANQITGFSGVRAEDDGSVHGYQYAFVGIGGNISAVMFLSVLKWLDTMPRVGRYNINPVTSGWEVMEVRLYFSLSSYWRRNSSSRLVRSISVSSRAQSVNQAFVRCR